MIQFLIYFYVFFKFVILEGFGKFMLNFSYLGLNKTLKKFQPTSSKQNATN